jgi:hypothetical protein
MVKLSGPDCFQLPRLGFLMWSRDEGAVVGREGEHHSGEWKDECRPGSFCCCFVVVFLFWNTPHVEFQVSKSPVQTPHFQPQTSNSKLPLSSVHIKSSKLQIQNFRFRNANVKQPIPNLVLSNFKFKLLKF